MREGGENCLKYLKSGWNRAEERRHKDLKKGGRRLGQEESDLKSGGLEPPYEICVNSKIKQKPKIILGVIRNLVLDFILYFGTAYILREDTL